MFTTDKTQTYILFHCHYI